MPNTKYTFVSDDADVRKTLEKMSQQMDKLRDQNKKLADESKRGSKQAKSGLDSTITSMARAAEGYLSIRAAIQLVNKELRHKIELDQQAGNTAVEVADKQAEAILNIGDVRRKDVTKLIAGVRAIKDVTRYPSEKPLLEAAGAVLSATAGNRDLTLDIVGAAAPLFRGKPEQIADFGGSLGDIMKATQSKDARQTAALMLAIQGQARFKELEAFKQVAPAMQTAWITAKGMPRIEAVRQGAGLFAGIGSLAGDVDAAITKTATANLMSNLADVVPGKATHFERLTAVQQSPRLQAEVLRSGFKASIKKVIQDLVSEPGSQTDIAVREAYGKMQGSVEAFDRKVEQLKFGTPELTTAYMKRGLQGIGEGLDLVFGAEGGRKEIMREELYKDYAKSGAGWMATQEAFGPMGLFRLRTMFGRDKYETAIELLEQRQRQLLGVDIAGRNILGAGRGPSPEGLLAADKLDRAIEILQETRDNAKQPMLDPNRHTE